MAPPCAVVVPEMMQRVACGPDGRSRFEMHGRCFFLAVETPGTRATKRRLPAVNQERRRSKPGEICVRRIYPLRTSIGSLRSATVGFLHPRLAAHGISALCVPDVEPEIIQVRFRNQTEVVS
jgi:hypothetical protein